MGYERFIFTEFHFQCISDKLGQFALNPLTVLTVSFDCY